MASAVVVCAPRDQEPPDDAGDRAEGAAGALGADEAASGALAGDEGALATEALSAAQETSYESGLPLEGEGERLVEGYRARGDCVVAQAGYLDLAGSVWGCVMQGEGWVDICVVRDADQGKGSFVVIWHMDADEVGAAVGQP